MSPRALAIFCVICAQSHAAFAQLSPATYAELSPAAKLHLVSVNQLGIVEYCHDRGRVGADAVAAERKAVLSVPSGKLSTVRAEELGRDGISVSPEGEQISVAKLAAQQSMTVQALCEDLAQSSLQFQAALHKPGTGVPGQ